MIYRKRDKVYNILSLFIHILYFITMLFGSVGAFITGFVKSLNPETMFEAFFEIFFYTPLFAFLSIVFFNLCKMVQEYDVYLHNYERLSKALNLKKGVKYTQEDINKLVQENSK